MEEIKKILKKRDAYFDEYLDLLSPCLTHKKIARRNYIAYLNREADARIYDIIKKERPEIYALLKKVQYTTQQAESVSATKERATVNYETKFLAIPPYINSTCYDKTLSKIWNATQIIYAEAILENQQNRPLIKKYNGNNHRAQQ